jgi:mono/diheme cytochrome c family protein
MRRWFWLLGVLVLVGIGAGVYFLRPVTGPARDLTLIGNVERGNDLILLGGCVACHTDSAGGRAFLSGGSGLQTPFGTFVPPNITSDPNAGIGDWTLAQFSDAMSNGIGPQGHLYPVFPYENYTLMSDQEIVDLYAALMATEPVSEPAAESQIPFPFNLRLAMAGWQNLFFAPARFAPETGRSDTYNRGKYLAYGPAHCVACHTPRNALGALEWDKALTGSPLPSPARRCSKKATTSRPWHRPWPTASPPASMCWADRWAKSSRTALRNGPTRIARRSRNICWRSDQAPARMASASFSVMVVWCSQFPSVSG